MADSPIRDGGDQPLDDEKPLRTAAETGATSSGARGAATPAGHGATGGAPLPPPSRGDRAQSGGGPAAQAG